MSQVNVDTINEYNSAAGVTIDGLLIKDGAIPSISGGLSSAQQFRLTANVTSTGDITANWEVPDTENQGNMGSLVSESSGIFTFSETGFYFISFGAVHDVNPAGDATAEISIHLTNDNSTYTASAIGTFGGSQVRDAGFGNVSTIIDVTNTTNDKVKFNFIEYTGNTRIIGSTTANKTCVTFMKLGDT